MDSPKVDDYAGAAMVLSETGKAVADARALRRHHHRQRRRRRHARPHARGRAASGSCCSNAATSCPGRWRTGTRTRSSSTAATCRPRRGTTPTASRSSRRCTTSSAARPSSTAPRCTGSARRTSVSCKHVDGISPAWPVTYDDFEPYYTKAEWLYQVHGNHGEDPTEGALEQAVPVARGLARAAHPGARRRRSRAGGYHPFHAPCGDPARRGGPRAERVHPLHLVRRVSRVSCTPSPTPTRSRSARCSTGRT